YRLPAGRDQVDEQREIVHTRVPLGEQVALEPLEAADDLVLEPAHLREVAHARAEMLAQAVLDVHGKPRLQLGSRLRQRLQRLTGPLEGGVDGRRLDPAFGCLLEPFPRAFDGFVHAATITLRSDEDSGARLRPAAGADRPASGLPARRFAAARLRP